MRGTRAATLEDLPVLMRLAEAFHQEVSPPWPWDGPTVERTLARCIRDDAGVALVMVSHAGSVVGGVLGVVTPAALHAGLEAHEVGLFVAPDHRGFAGLRLVRAFRAAARARGAGLIVMQDWGGRAGAVYSRLGLRSRATVWIG